MTHPIEIPPGSSAPACASVLVVDDETGVRELMARWLASGGYDVRTASNADEALARVRDRAPAVALCDIRMPGHDGLWLAHQIRHDAPETAVIMATGVQDVGSAVTSLRQGVIDYLTKPFGRDRLRESVVRGIEWHKAARDSRRWREALEGEVENRRQRLQDALAALPIDCDAALDGLLSVLTLSDRDAYAHAYRVAALAASVGCAMHLPQEDMEALERAALLHDVGKLAISNRILDKPARLTEEEFALVRRHPLYTSSILERTPGFSGLASLAGAHHERLDGSGYPHGLDGGALTVPMRILAVADVYEALTSARPYRPAMSSAEALEVIRPDVPRRLDRDAFSALEAVLEERRPETPATTATAAVDDAIRAEAVVGRRLR